MRYLLRRRENRKDIKDPEQTACLVLLGVPVRRPPHALVHIKLRQRCTAEGRNWNFRDLMDLAMPSYSGVHPILMGGH